MTLDLLPTKNEKVFHWQLLTQPSFSILRLSESLVREGFPHDHMTRETQVIRDTPYREQPHPLWYVQNLVQRISLRRLNTFHLLSCVLYHVMYLVSGNMSPFFMTWTKHFIELFKFAFYIRTWQNDNRRQIKSPQWSFLEL